MFNTIVGARAVRAGATWRYGSDQMMRLLAALALQHCFLEQISPPKKFKKKFDQKFI
jgi:hypothetical protein